MKTSLLLLGVMTLPLFAASDAQECPAENLAAQAAHAANAPLAATTQAGNSTATKSPAPAAPTAPAPKPSGKGAEKKSTRPEYLFL